MALINSLLTINQCLLKEKNKNRLFIIVDFGMCCKKLLLLKRRGYEKVF